MSTSSSSSSRPRPSFFRRYKNFIVGIPLLGVLAASAAFPLYYLSIKRDSPLPMVPENSKAAQIMKSMSSSAASSSSSSSPSLPPANGSLTLRPSALPPQAGIRGAYLNSGSKDLGIDPQFYERQQKIKEQLRRLEREREEQERSQKNS